VSRPLNDAERRFALPLPYQSGEKFTYKNLAQVPGQGRLAARILPLSAACPTPARGNKADEKAKNPEDQPLVKLPAWHELRLAFQRAKLANTWQQIATPALEGQPELMDQIGWVLSVYKDDTEVSAELAKLEPAGRRTGARHLAGTVRFDKFHALSLKALRRIVPLMETGLRYDEAVKAIPEYGHHSQLFVGGAGGQRYLPSFYEGRDATGRMKFREDLDVPRNPVVLRALNQARKVVNALIREYGPPSAVHIEMARDLSRPLDERRDS
jgi:CRISPR-associated endonuclease Csn1